MGGAHFQGIGERMENCEDFLTELSSGLLTSSCGNESSTEKDSPTFSYSSITCLESREPGDVDWSMYGIVNNSDGLAECTTSDEFSEQSINFGTRIVKGYVGKKSLKIDWRDSSVFTDEDCYETAQESLEDNFKDENQNDFINSDKKPEIGNPEEFVENKMEVLEGMINVLI